MTPLPSAAPDALADRPGPGPTAQPILEARALTRHYRMAGELIEAVSGVSLQVMPGEFVAFKLPRGHDPPVAPAYP